MYIFNVWLTLHLNMALLVEDPYNRVCIKRPHNIYDIVPTSKDWGVLAPETKINANWITDLNVHVILYNFYRKKQEKVLVTVAKMSQM